MNAIQLRQFAISMSLGAFLAIAACAAKNPVVDLSGETLDGMVPVRDSGMKEAWVKPDINISSYRQIMVLPADFQFRPVDPGADTSMFSWQYREFPLTEANQQQLVDTVTDAFREELAKSRHLTITTTPGPDVLLVKVSLIDIVSKVPPEQPARTEIFLDEIGAATLVLELQDSQSGETLARAVDRRTAEPIPGSIQSGSEVGRLNPVIAWSEVRRVARRWASVVTERIDQLYTRGRMPGQAPA